MPNTLSLKKLRKEIRNKLIEENKKALIKEYEYENLFNSDANNANDTMLNTSGIDTDVNIGDTVKYIDKAIGQERTGTIEAMLGTQVKVQTEDGIHFTPITWITNKLINGNWISIIEYAH